MLDCSSNDIRGETGETASYLEQGIQAAMLPIVLGIAAGITTLVFFLAVYEYKRRSIEKIGYWGGVIDKEPTPNGNTVL